MVFRELDLLSSPLYTELVGPLKKQITQGAKRDGLLGEIIRPQLSNGWLRVLGMFSVYQYKKREPSS